jgi:condensin complex subunit 3
MICVVKFHTNYVRKAAENQSEDEEDTVVSRFVSRLLKFLFQGFQAKDKSARYRVIQLVAEMVSHLGEIE